MARLQSWATAVVPVPLGLWHAVDSHDVHHRYGYVTPGDRGVGRVVMFCPALLVSTTRSLDVYWLDDYLCTVETHLTLHAETDLDEEAVVHELERRAPDSMAIARTVEAAAMARF